MSSGGLAAVLERIPHQPAGGALDAFLAERAWSRALKLWFGDRGPFGGDWSRPRILAALDLAIAEIDALLDEQLNLILHHPRFQKLEASWRSIRYLVAAASDAENVKIRVIQMSWGELCRDLERAIEFDQSVTFQKIYNEEFGMPGGQPYGLLIGDYEVSHSRGAGRPTDDVAALKAMSQVAAAGFVPFIVGIAPSLLGLDGFRDLALPIDLPAIFRTPDYIRWKSFREMEDAKFIGLTLPRILVRPAYRDDGSRIDGFRFQEQSEALGGEQHLWGCAAYAFASVVIRSYAASGWFTDIRGARRDRPLGGLVVDLPVPSFSTDRPGLAIKPSTDMVLTERQEKDLSDLGFIPLLKAKDTPYSVYFSNQSAEQHKTYDSLAATVNARISTMLQYILCVSRFAHYIKVLARDRVGSFATPEECELFLQRWLLQYCNGNPRASADTMARYPLREGRVEVRERPGRPGDYACTIFLRPYSQVDQVISEFKLVTEISPRNGARV